MASSDAPLDEGFLPPDNPAMSPDWLSDFLSEAEPDSLSVGKRLKMVESTGRASVR